jgi:O-ureido-D-serine cyclo-ligase
VTARAARGTDYDMPPLLSALRAAGADAHEVDWDNDTVEWPSFDLALLRSTWDYFERLPEFLGWAARASRQTRLLNPLDVVRWNTDQHYLADLARAGVPVVPGRFIEPGDDAMSAVGDFFAVHAPTHDVVVKPSVGAGSRDAQRHALDRREAIIAHVRRLLDANRSVLLQPYLERVDAHGETALLFFEGRFSHAIRKGPLLKRDDGPTAGLYATETITPRAPSADELDVARRALAAIPFDKPLLYARIDLIDDDDGSPRLLELELVEPSVFVEHADGVAERFAEAIIQRANGS